MTGVLTSKTAVVTGGSRGIGAAIVEALLAEGAQVLTCGRGDGSEHLPAGARWMTADVSKVEDVDALADTTLSLLGRVDIVINNAGIQIEKTIVDSTDEDWNLLMGTNARAIFFMCRRFIPIMAKSSGGSIVNIGSISANHADPSMALYNASKAFVHGLTRSIAVDHGHQGIRCNAICPGWIMTGMADAAFAQAKRPEAAKADALARHPAGRLGTPGDVAKAAVWLASEGAAFVTGQTLTVDGGLVAASPLQPGFF